MVNILIKIWTTFIGFFEKKSIKEIQTPTVDIPIKRFCYEFANDIPQCIEKDKIYIIGENNFHWVLIFLCPCGCKESVHLNLLEDTTPSWTYFINDGINIKPSVWRNIGCKSHFFITCGEVKWVCHDNEI